MFFSGAADQLSAPVEDRKREVGGAVEWVEQEEGAPTRT